MSDPYATMLLSTNGEQMTKNVSDLGSELITLMRKRDNILYPSLDNHGNAYVSLYAMIAVWYDYEFTKDEVITRLEQKISEVQKEIEVL
jgi:iron-sulfur cluster repair protein YtfE (RIC family)